MSSDGLVKTELSSGKEINELPIILFCYYIEAPNQSQLNVSSSCPNQPTPDMYELLENSTEQNTRLQHTAGMTSIQ